MQKFAAVLTILFSLFLIACNQKSSIEPLRPDALILAFGNSVTYGTGRGRGKNYPELLAEKTGLKVVNAGIPGDTAQTAKNRIEALLTMHNPTLVIVELGGNDFLAKRNTDKVKQDLQSILESIQDRGASVILISVPELSVLRATLGVLKDSPIYGELGDEFKITVVDKLLAGILSDQKLRSDAIHPNADGYRNLANGIFRAMYEAGFLNIDRGD